MISTLLLATDSNFVLHVRLPQAFDSRQFLRLFQESVLELEEEKERKKKIDGFVEQIKH